MSSNELEVVLLSDSLGHDLPWSMWAVEEYKGYIGDKAVQQLRARGYRYEWYLLLANGTALGTNNPIIVSNDKKSGSDGELIFVRPLQLFASNGSQFFELVDN